MSTPQLKGKATLDDSQMEAAFRRIEKGGIQAAGKVKGAFAGLVSPIAAIGPAIAAAFTGRAIVNGVAGVFDAGRALRVMSRETGASVAGLVVLQSKFKQAGLDGDLVARSIFRLQKSLDGVEDEENKGGAGRLAQLGLNLANLKKLAPDQQLLAVGRAISSIQDPAERTAAAMQIFGKTGAELGAVFNKPGFADVAPGLQQKAQMMARNAGIFEEVSIKLERTGNVLKTFYVGVADRVATSLVPILDQIDKVNLVSIGQAFGDGLAKGAAALLPAMKAVAAIDWNKVASVLGNGITFVAKDLAGKPGIDIGGKDDQKIISLVKDGWQGIANLVGQNTVDLKDADPAATARAMSNRHVAPPLYDDFTVSSLNNRPETRAVNTRRETLPRQREQTLPDPSRAAPLSAPSRPYSPAELENMRAQEYERQMAAQKAAASGDIGNKSVIAAGDQTYLARMALANGGMNTRGMTPDAIGKFAASHVYMGGNSVDANGNANDPYTMRVDGERRARQFANHAIGVGGALDFDPSQGKGWTGAKNAAEGFRRGISGGAYGRTGNVMTQVSGRVGGSGDPAADTAKNTADLLSEFRNTWGKGGGSGGASGGGGATATH